MAVKMFPENDPVLKGLTIAEGFRRTNYLRAMELLKGLSRMDEAEINELQDLAMEFDDERIESERYQKSCDEMGRHPINGGY